MGRRFVSVGVLVLIAVVAVGWLTDRHKPATPPALAAPKPGSHQRASVRKSTAPVTAAGPLTWHILSTHTTRRIENQYLPSVASGVYVVMDITATNATGHTVPLDTHRVDLELGRIEYPLDSRALSALALAGDKTFSVTDLAPKGTATGWVVFDVPPRAVAATHQLCIAGPVALDSGAATAACMS